MFDGIKILNLSVSVDGLLHNPLLLFPLQVDEQTGTILTDRPRRETYKGITFKLTPVRANRSKLICELKGSLHKYKNDGSHNANDFTAEELLAVLDEVVCCFGVDPYRSTLNNVEFGVNIRLTFPVAELLAALICYKGEPFVKDSANGGIYYQATLSQYAVKVYDKGRQFNLAGNLLRVEVKVFKMQYLKGRGVNLHCLADLMNVAQYPAIGNLLAETFEGILFDCPTVTRNPPDTLKAIDRQLLREGRFPGFWQVLPGLTGKDYAREQKRLKRQEQRFRELTGQYRDKLEGYAETAGLIRQKWGELTQLTPELSTRIAEVLTQWRQKDVEPVAPANAVDSETEPVRFLPPDNSTLSVFYTLGLGEETDTPAEEGKQQIVVHTTSTDRQNLRKPEFSTVTGSVTTWKRIGQSVDYCITTGERITHQRTPHRFVSQSTVADRRVLFADLLKKHKKNRRKHDHPEPYYSAHNARNDYTNPANNLRRRLMKLAERPGLFPLSEMFRLTPQQIALLERWRGSPYDVLGFLESLNRSEPEKT